jgi:MFS family permease
MTPFSVSMVVGAILSTQLIGRLKGYRIVTIVSALLMSVGTFLITFMNPQTNIVLAISILVLTGIGIGPFFSLPMVVVQNALPADRLGVSTAGLRYLGQLGASLGIAIVGTIVTSSVSGNLINQFPTTIADKTALSTALQHGFLAVMIFALIALVAAFFLKEVPLKATQDQPLSENTTQEDEKSSMEMIQA